MSLVIDFFLISGIVVNSIILLILLKSTKKQLPQKLLILFFFSLLLYMLHSYADIKDIKTLWISTFIFNDILELLLGPILLMYVKSLFENNKELLTKNWFHFLPLIIYTVMVSVPLLISMSKNEFVFDYLVFFNEHRSVFFSILMIYLIIYMVIALKRLLKYRAIMQYNFSSILENDLQWVKNMLYGAITVATTSFLITVYEIITGEEGYYDFITLFLVVIFIVFLGYYGVKQTKILLPDFLINEAISNKKKNKSNDVFKNVDRQELQRLEQRVLDVLKNDQLFLDEDLTLNKLAQKVGTTDKKLSTLLNQYMNSTFYDIVNKYRVEEVKKKIKCADFENYTLLGIAYDAGFKSKTSFNRIFKKETGLSPSEFKKKYK